jgi:hypothetical protein
MIKMSQLIILAACLFSGFLALHPKLNKAVKYTFQKKYRTVLSTVSGRIMDDGKITKVVKLKTKDGIFLEIYHGDKSLKPLISKIKLPDARDAYFIFQGQSTNLALEDLDGDNKLEILVPSFDKNLVAHLNVYKFNKKSNTFELFKKN